MQDETDRFWKDLQAKVNQGSPSGSIDDLSMEEAERRMAEAGEAPFTGDEIDEMVRSAVGEDAGLRVVGTPDPVEDKRSFLRKYSGLTKVAAGLLGMLLLYSVGEFAMREADSGTIAIETDGLLEAQDRLVNGVEELLDPQTSESRRVLAQGEVYFFTRASILALREAQTAGMESVQLYLAILLDELDSEESASSVEDLVPLLGSLPDPGSSQATNMTFLEAVATQARYGIKILKAVRTDNESDQLNKNLELILLRLREAIGS